MKVYVDKARRSAVANLVHYLFIENTMVVIAEKHTSYTYGSKMLQRLTEHVELLVILRFWKYVSTHPEVSVYRNQLCH
jgi:hypothetical protein